MVYVLKEVRLFSQNLLCLGKLGAEKRLL